MLIELKLPVPMAEVPTEGDINNDLAIPWSHRYCNGLTGKAGIARLEQIIGLCLPALSVEG